MENGSEIIRQISLIEEAMRGAGFWTESAPEWVQQYTGDGTMDVWSWLQYVHLPQRMRGIPARPPYIAPQLREHLDLGQRTHREVIRRLIELDSMTP